MRGLLLAEVIRLHSRVVVQSGGADGIRDQAALESAVAQPSMTFGGVDLYPTLIDKACALGFSLIGNHPFVDGNKRIGHAAIETLLVLNGYEISSTVDEQEPLILHAAAGELTREALLEWLTDHVVKFSGDDTQ